MRPPKGIWLFVLCLVVALVSLPAFAAGFVIDEAHMFSPATIDQINQRNQQMLQSVKKEVLVITVPSVNGAWQQAAQGYLGSRPVNGVLIFIDKGAHKTYVGVGNKTKEVFGEDRKAALKQTINDQFKQGRFDDGILAGMTYVQNTLQSAVPATRGGQYSAPMGRPQPAPSGGGIGFGGILVGLIVLWIIWSIIKAVFRRNAYGGGVGYGGGGYPAGGQGPYGAAPMGGGYPVQQGGGGGFLSSLLGGAGGAFLGNALYDRFERRNEGYQGPMDTGGAGGFMGGGAPSTPDWQAPDTGMDMSDTGSSWGDSSSTADTGSSWSSDSGSSWGGGGGDSGGGGGNSDWS